MPRAVKEWIGKFPETPPPPRVKLRVWTRENGICYLSGRKIQPGEPYQYEHKIAIINGGENRESNLFLALTDKHKEKTRADLAEKSHVADLAKSHIGAKSPRRKIKSPGFSPPAPKDHSLTKTTPGPPAMARRFLNTTAS